VEACFDQGGETLRALAAFHAKELSLRLGRTAAEVEVISTSTSLGRDLSSRSLVLVDA
jgi:hypothetical protein